MDATRQVIHPVGETRQTVYLHGIRTADKKSRFESIRNSSLSSRSGNIHRCSRKGPFTKNDSVLVISCQLSVISYQLSVISCQLSVISCQLSVISCQLSVVSCQLSVVSYQLSVVSCQLSVVSYQFLFEDYSRLLRKFAMYLNVIIYQCVAFTKWKQ